MSKPCLAGGTWDSPWRIWLVSLHWDATTRALLWQEIPEYIF